MATLFASLYTSADALDAFETAIGVIQNNVASASVPGYANENLDLTARPFEPTEGLLGGVEAGDIQSSRSQYAEQSVWSQNELLGSAAQQATSLSSLQGLFDVSGQSGIPAALSGLYSAFSAWSATPSDSVARQQVINAAQQMAQAFNETSSGIQTVESQTDAQAKSTVRQINQLTSQIAALNAQIRDGNANDGGVQAQLYSTLEQLSNLTGISVRIESDGTATVLMDGQVPLVIGTTQTQLQVQNASAIGAPNPNAPADLEIVSVDGQDVTSLASEGQLGGLLQFRNVMLPSIIGNGYQQGSLNQLAQRIADRVNALLTSGQVSSGPPAVPGSPLFTYAAGSPTSVAGTLALDPSITASQLAAIDPGPPPVANGIADKLAGLATSQNAPDLINGLSYTQFYGGIASNVGQQEASASQNQELQTQLLTQAQSLRSQISGVSLNEQAAKLLEFQQAYEASAQVIKTISDTSLDLLTVLQNP